MGGTIEGGGAAPMYVPSALTANCPPTCPNAPGTKDICSVATCPAPIIPMPLALPKHRKNPRTAYDQEESKQNEVDGMKKEADSTGQVMHIENSSW